MRMLLALLLCWPLLATAEYLDADNRDEAFAMIYLERAAIEHTRKLCSEALPEHQRVFDVSALRWLDNNKTELRGLDQIHAIERKGVDQSGLFGAFLDGIIAGLKTAVATAGSEAVCGDFVQKISNGERNIAKRTPNAARFLTAYLAEHPLSEVQEGRLNMTSGCTKAFVNKEMALDFALAACPCMTEAYYTGMTAEELAELDRLARARQSTLALPAVQRLAPEIGKCMAAATGQ